MRTAWSGRGLPRASRVLTVGDGSTRDGVAWTKPSEVLGVAWDRFAAPPWDAETHTAGNPLPFCVTVATQSAGNLLLSLSPGSGTHSSSLKTVVGGEERLEHGSLCPSVTSSWTHWEALISGSRRTFSAEETTSGVGNRT